MLFKIQSKRLLIRFWRYMIIDNFIGHRITGKAIKTKVFETWYFDASLDKWTFIRPDVKVYDCKHVEYYVVDGCRHDKLEDAKEAMMQSIVKQILVDAPTQEYIEEDKPCVGCFAYKGRDKLEACQDLSNVCGMYCWV